MVLKLDLLLCSASNSVVKEPVNPYAAPEAIIKDPIVMNFEPEVSGKLIVVDKKADLPEYCFLTGEDVSPEDRLNKSLYFVSSLWVLLIFLGIIGIIIYIVINLTTRKKTFVCYSLSKAGKKNLAKKRLIGTTVSLFILVAAVFAFMQVTEEMIKFGFVGIVLFTIALIISIYKGSVMRVRKYKNGRFYLSGSGQGFRDRLLQKQSGIAM